MLLIYYIVAFLVSFACWIFFVAFETKKMNINLAMIFTIVTVSNGGYLALALSNNVESALLAQKIIYLVVIYAPLFILFNVAALCKVNIPKWLRLILVLVASSIYLMVLSAGYFDFYYKSIKLHKYYGATYITKEYGPAHIIYSISTYSIVIFSLIIIIYAFYHQDNVSIKNSITLFVILMMVITTFFGKKITGSNVQLMPMIYAILVMVLFVLYRRTDKYDISYAILDTLEQEIYGYVVLDNKFKFIGCNDLAKLYYPALNDLKIDRSIENDQVLFFQIRKKAERLVDEESVIWNKNVNKYNLKIELHALKNGKKRYGYLIELIDDTKQQQYIKSINLYNSKLQDTVNKKSQELIEVQNKIILGMANVVESRDNSTGGHIKRTSEVVRIFANKLKNAKMKYNINEEFLENVVKAAPMHDMGKIAIDDSILRKPGRFTAEEYKEMKKHAYEGELIINAVLEGVEDEEFVCIAKNIAHYHHEKFDGSGYPDNLSGEEIPLEARIMALADVFDALVSKRCYKEKFTYDEAFEIIEESIGSHFDPEIGKVFIKCRSDLENYYDQVEA